MRHNADMDLSVCLALLEQDPLILDNTPCEARKVHLVEAHEVVADHVLVPELEFELR